LYYSAKQFPCGECDNLVIVNDKEYSTYHFYVCIVLSEVSENQITGKTYNSVIVEAAVNFSEGASTNFQGENYLTENLLRSLHLSPSK
jgi:hypothetical protein